VSTFADAAPTDSESVRQQAISRYIEGATKELDAFGQQINAAARPDNLQQCNEARAKLNECKELLADLRTADPEHFDLVKENYERTRGELAKALLAAQKK